MDKKTEIKNEEQLDQVSGGLGGTGYKPNLMPGQPCPADGALVTFVSWVVENRHGQCQCPTCLTVYDFYQQPSKSGESITAKGLSSNSRQTLI